MLPVYLATFQPPDFTADMYDSIPVDDMDFEDIEWQKWLQGLVSSGIYHVHIGESLMTCKFSMFNMFFSRQSWVFAKKIKKANVQPSWQNNSSSGQFLQCKRILFWAKQGSKQKRSSNKGKKFITAFVY